MTVGLRIAIVALLSVLASTQSAAAHVPNIASFHLIPGEDAWRLEVNMSTDGMHQALQSARPGEDLSALSPEAYERLLVDNLREGIVLQVDGATLSLDHPIVEVRSHASRVVFVMAPPQSQAHRIDARIDALSARGGQNNVFRFLGVPRAHVVLKAENEFRGALELGAPAPAEPAAEPAENPDAPATIEGASNPRQVWFPAVILLLGVVLAGSGVSRSRDRLVP